MSLVVCLRRRVRLGALAGAVGLLCAGVAFADTPPGRPVVYGEVKMNDPLGPDGVPSGLTVEESVHDSTCDDDPRGQNEIAISVDPNDRNILLAAWNDASRTYLEENSPTLLGRYGIGYAVSLDAGDTWLRLDRAGASYPCAPDVFQFVPGHAFSRDDLCPSPGVGPQGDPIAAIGANGYLYLAGVSKAAQDPPFFARFDMDPLSTTPWESTLVPVGAALTAFDGPFVLADPYDDNVYVHWAQGQNSTSTVQLSASRCAGCDFFEGSIGCTCTEPSVVMGRNLALRPSPQLCGLGVCTWGTSSAVGPDGSLHIIWKHWGGASDLNTPLNDQIDQIRYRRGWWVGDDMMFDPPLPESDPSVKCDPPLTKAVASVGSFSASPGTPRASAGPRDISQRVP